MELPVKTRLQIFEDVLRFHIFAAEKGYAAVDLYDSTLMYDREQGRTFLCDIDFYRKAPLVNEMGRMWGSSLFMSPEEFERGAVISETTNVYTLGAMAFALFANYRREAEAWTLTPELFAVAQKATRNEREERYKTLTELLEAWTAAQSSL
ncbi:MAG: serine/threonine protein kinase, partial [Clostridia bacterium]|nr:serine/threonine protein kinase [Clostridia bacterium]